MHRFFRTRLGSFVLFLIFAVASQLIEFGVSWLVFEKLKLVDTTNMTWRPTLFILFEGVSALSVFIAMILVAKLGDRSLADLGMGVRNGIRNLFEGSAYGLLMPTVLVVAIAALGAFTFGSVAMHGAKLLTYVVAWLVVMFLLGLAEESTYRGPALMLLGDSIGFWPAAVVTSALFILGHAGKPHENFADLASVGLLGFFMCYTVRRTGSIWWAVGFHALFDYAALFMYGAPNSGNQGQPIATRLLTGTFHGPRWLTGADLGMESSWLIFPLLAIVWTAFHFATIARKQKEEMPCGDSVSQPAR